MVTNSRISDLIREDKSEEISEAIGEGSFFQMQTFTQALIGLVLAGDVERELAADASSNRHDFLVELDQALKRHAVGSDDKTNTQPEQAPNPEDEPIPELRVVRPAER